MFIELSQKTALFTRMFYEQGACTQIAILFDSWSQVLAIILRHTQARVSGNFVKGTGAKLVAGSGTDTVGNCVFDDFPDLFKCRFYLAFKVLV